MKKAAYSAERTREVECNAHRRLFTFDGLNGSSGKIDICAEIHAHGSTRFGVSYLLKGAREILARRMRKTCRSNVKELLIECVVIGSEDDTPVCTAQLFLFSEFGLTTEARKHDHIYI